MKGRLALMVATAMVGLACSSDPIVVQSARIEPPAEMGFESDEQERETISAPDFELELEPGQEADQVLDFGFDELDLDAAGTGSDEPTSAIDRPGDAIVSLCPALGMLLIETPSAEALAVLQDDTPEPWAEQLADVDPATFVPSEPPSGLEVGGLDAYYYDACSIPLFTAAAELDADCDGGTEGCVRDRIAELGGLCFDEADPEGGTRTFVLLSCVSGLPAN